MNKEMKFFIYLLEKYAEYKNTTADKVLNMFDNLKITDLIYDMYEQYHTEAIENAFEDIDKMVLENS